MANKSFNDMIRREIKDSARMAEKASDESILSAIAEYKPFIGGFSLNTHNILCAEEY